MEHYIFYCKLSLLAVLSLITACCMLSRRWYVNLAAFLACLSGETFLAHLFFPGYMLCPAAASFIILFLSRIWDLSRTSAKGNGADPIRLPVRSGIRESRLEFYYHYSNFLVYGGAGSGKTKSIGKWLLSEYMRLGFAGFIYDFKDTDYTRTAYNLIKRHRYPHKFYYVSFDRPERSYRFNPLKVVRDRTELIQLMEDVLLALLPKKEQQNEWVAGGLGILRGVAFRFWDEFPEHCTLPHILAFIMTASARQLSLFLQQNLVSEMLAGAYLKAEGSEKTQASYLSTLCNNLATVSQNEEIAYVLSGDDFDFNLIDPENPKLFAISNNFSKNSVYAPVIGMLMSTVSRYTIVETNVSGIMQHMGDSLLLRRQAFIMPRRAVVGVKPGQHAAAVGAAQRVAGYRRRKVDPTHGQLVNIGGADVGFAVAAQRLGAQLALLGPLRAAEWVAALAFVVFLLGSFLPQWHQSQAAWLAGLMLAALLVLGLLNKQAFQGKIDWPMIFFLLSLDGLTEAINYLGLDKLMLASLGNSLQWMDGSLLWFTLLALVASYALALRLATLLAQNILKKQCYLTG